jgi:hypothetical protein
MIVFHSSNYTSLVVSRLGLLWVAMGTYTRVSGSADIKTGKGSTPTPPEPRTPGTGKTTRRRDTGPTAMVSAVCSAMSVSRL